MVLLAFLALALAGVAVAALLRLLTLSRTRIVTNLDDVGAYGYAAAVPATADPVDQRSPLAAIAGQLGAFIVGRMGADREDKLRNLLMGAGMYSTSTRTLQGYRVLVTMMFSGLGVLMGGSVLQRVAMAGLLAVLGWRFSLVFLQRRAKGRALEIERETPNLIDQIVVSLEAGIGFSAALQTSTNRLSGPLGDEIRLALQEQRMGASLSESLNQLRERVDSTNLRSFVRAVVQGEKLGVSIGQVMRDLAVDMRKRRRQMAEERAQKTPVKLLVPLVFLILPTIFIVVLVPPLLTLMHQL